MRLLAFRLFSYEYLMNGGGAFEMSLAALALALARGHLPFHSTT